MPVEVVDFGLLLPFSAAPRLTAARHRRDLEVARRIDPEERLNLAFHMLLTLWGRTVHQMLTIYVTYCINLIKFEIWVGRRVFGPSLVSLLIRDVEDSLNGWRVDSRALLLTRE